ncbi:hypothetical protein EJ02DRAFT_265940 [Clathrospora elynae]|uniref:Uncharacterized protein n=1 Tax=Clathrospora elynae TaxID=706981 RepID=A0A6A5SEL6_9PLEO|nr:hypothetical protein EJ02DRAFT_265940 [Clathrospora elynae]
MAQSSLAPTSRQDIVSALLNDYGSSFGRGDATASSYSPVPTFKELPPPPRSNNLARKPLPAVQKMMMKFELRDDQDASLSPGASSPNLPKPPTRRIVSRSLSREAKPPSLTLSISNGATAIIPPTPAFPVRSGPLSSSEAVEEKDPPPSPPAKSDRRQNVKQADMGNKLSKPVKKLARSDSLISPTEQNFEASLFSENAARPVVKRKVLPVLKKFKSLAELDNGPRGRKGAIIPPTSAPRKASIDSQAADTALGKVRGDSQTDASWATTEPVNKVRSDEQSRTTEAQLPPTPDEHNDMAPLAPPKKVFTGLPSNPRLRALPSPLHMRGKSSTGFNVLKAMRPAPPRPTMNTNPITPEMTPSPTLESMDTRKDMEISTVSSFSPPSDQRRPFSYESRAKPQHKPIHELVRPSTAATLAPTPPAESQIPIQTTTLELPQHPPQIKPLSSPFCPTSQDLDLASSPPSSPSADATTIERETIPTPPFTPLTRHPIPMPVAFVPQITEVHLHCYTSHKTNMWSNNAFQPMACMLCHSNERDRKWACTWCLLRICRGCSEELAMVPERDLGVLLERRKGEGMRELAGNPGIVVEDVDEEGEGGSDPFENSSRA